MSTPTDVNNSLFEVYVFLQDVMKQHEIIDSTLKDLSVCEENQDFTPLETASIAIIDACKKIEIQLNPPKSECCCAAYARLFFPAKLSAGRDVGRFSQKPLPPLQPPRTAQFARAAAICKARWGAAAAGVNIVVRCERRVRCSSLTLGLSSACTPCIC